MNSSSPSSRKLSADALAIWQAGVDAVRPDRLIADRVEIRGAHLAFDDVEIDLRKTRRLVVVGGGKASAGLASEFYRQWVPELARQHPGLRIEGWINCPEGTFSPQTDTGAIRLFAARPQGINVPTEQAVLGTQKILELARGCGPDDVLLCLLSGGGSALLAAPAAGISLQDKQAVAKLIAAAGGNIEQLNSVRRCLSDIKGGGLARACRAKQLVCLVLSDVLGDSLETIASGPTVASADRDPQVALENLRNLGLLDAPELHNVVQFLMCQPIVDASVPTASHVEHVILGNNASAVDAAGVKAVELGYRYVMQSARSSEGDVLDLAQHAVAACLQLTEQPNVDCWISGGEPTVQLPSSGVVGKGGRNQQLTLAVLQNLFERGWPNAPLDFDLGFVSGGTDGEDGPTDAAGAWFDRELASRIRAEQLTPETFLTGANAYALFDQVGGLIRTGPTGTNVCDVRVCTVRK